MVDPSERAIRSVPRGSRRWCKHRAAGTVAGLRRGFPNLGRAAANKGTRDPASAHPSACDGPPAHRHPGRRPQPRHLTAADRRRPPPRHERREPGLHLRGWPKPPALPGPRGPGTDGRPPTNPGRAPADMPEGRNAAPRGPPGIGLAEPPGGGSAPSPEQPAATRMPTATSRTAAAQIETTVSTFNH